MEINRRLHVRYRRRYHRVDRADRPKVARWGIKKIVFNEKPVIARIFFFLIIEVFHYVSLFFI